MSAEDRLYKQLEGIVTSIIKALEGLEKEFSEYIEVTNKRLQTLENKIQKMESLADVREKGLVKAIESSTEPDKVKGLAHLTQNQHEVKSESKIQSKTLDKDFLPTQPKESKPDPTAEEKPAVKIPEVPSTPPIQTPKVEESLVSPPTDEKTVPQPPTTIKTKEDTKKKTEDDDKEELMSALKIIDSL